MVGLNGDGRRRVVLLLLLLVELLRVGEALAIIGRLMLDPI